jgi:hypothetical protein
LGRKIPSEATPHNSIATVSSGDLAPVDSEFVAKLVGSICLGNKSNTLSEVKINIGLGVNSLNFDQTDIVVLVTETTLVAKDGTIDMKLCGSGRHY